MKYSKAEIQEAKDDLREILKPGDTVYTKLVHVSRSGMYRVISLYVIRDNRPRCIDYRAAKLLEGWDDRHWGCKASGCGMDMGFHLVYNLGRVLFGEWDCIGEHCPANDHFNRDWEGEEISKHRDGGYALRQQWL